ncbi:MAG: hypothetical protein JKY53_07550, partial [Flavobacteriales bacterium]|nr:hypothetical protein [Flavobacteriales bacterium]
LTFSISISYSQGISTKETVEYINSKFPTVFQVRVEKEREIYIDFYKGGQVYRTDRIYLSTLDPKKTKYNTDEKALSLYCLKEMPREFKKFGDGCIERTFHQKGVRRQYFRVNMNVGYSEKTINGLIVAFNHLIKISNDEGEYMGVDFFE